MKLLVHFSTYKRNFLKNIWSYIEKFQKSKKWIKRQTHQLFLSFEICIQKRLLKSNKSASSTCVSKHLKERKREKRRAKNVGFWKLRTLGKLYSETTMGEVEVEPNATYTLDNVTYCWHPEIEKYSWCPKDPSANQVDTGMKNVFSPFKYFNFKQIWFKATQNIRRSSTLWKIQIYSVFFISLVSLV